MKKYCFSCIHLNKIWNYLPIIRVNFLGAAFPIWTKRFIFTWPNIFNELLSCVIRAILHVLKTTQEISFHLWAQIKFYFWLYNHISAFKKKYKLFWFSDCFRFIPPLTQFQNLNQSNCMECRSKQNWMIISNFYWALKKSSRQTVRKIWDEACNSLK